MKIVYSILLALALMLVAAGCGAGGMPVDSSSAVSQSGTGTATPSPAAADRGFEPGILENDIYKNRYYGVQFVAPEGVTTSDGRMGEAMDEAEQEAGLKMEMAQQSGMVSYEMMAVDPVSTAALIVISEPLRSEMTDREYLQAVKEQFDSGVLANVELVFENDGEPEDVSLGGMGFSKLSYISTTGEQPPVYQDMFACAKGSHLLLLTGSVPASQGEAGRESLQRLYDAISILED